MEKKLIQWSAAFGAGMIWMDYQHQGLIEKINALYTAILEKKGEAHVAEMTAFLDQYVQSHFALEEAYMTQSGYPDRYEHFLAHDQFRKNLQEVKSVARKGELLAESLCYDLFEWFKGHITTTDKKLGIFLKNNASF